MKPARVAWPNSRDTQVRGLLTDGTPVSRELDGGVSLCDSLLQGCWDAAALRADMGSSHLLALIFRPEGVQPVTSDFTCMTFDNWDQIVRYLALLDWTQPSYPWVWDGSSLFRPDAVLRRLSPRVTVVPPGADPTRGSSSGRPIAVRAR